MNACFKLLFKETLESVLFSNIVIVNTKNYIIYLILFVFSCGEKFTLQSYNQETIQIESEKDSTILAIIQPYKDSIEHKMNKVLTYTKYDLKKGKPSSTLGNFVTDLCLYYANADICIMNNGGLRTNIDKGEITLEQIYQLMPFENELVLLKLNNDEYIEMLKYIIHRGGEPFSGIKITTNKNGDLIDFDNKRKDSILVLTTDYLANGGDRMSFFNDKEIDQVGIKLRDAIIDYCKRNDTISVKIDDRIKFIN